ncbi:hypothetical protein CSUI_006006 [Cystoisospora suis]|uniref:Uncharacterized protein n=1 Tax=Cystoisospora suis TaxID=483139 RepID=A0A2C6K2X4_9APIC|nr:hypothetical protein CSUI_006006 [Cystoisospora suis]
MSDSENYYITIALDSIVFQPVAFIDVSVSPVQSF